MKNLSKVFGGIDTGPSRETMFDSLRISIPISVRFMDTYGYPMTLKVLVVDVKKVKNTLNPYKDNDWNVELEIKLPKGRKELWFGSYSTSTRSGKILGDIPPCLVV